MSDITTAFLECVRQSRDSRPDPTPKTPKTPPQETSDTFLQECRTLYSHLTKLRRNLLRIRRAYLATSSAGTKRRDAFRGIDSAGENLSLTEQERDDIDYEANSILQAAVNKLRFLEQYEAERSRRSVHKRLALFGPSAAELRSKTVAECRKGVLASLGLLLKEVSDMESSQQESRLRRKAEAEKSVLHRLPESSGLGGPGGWVAQPLKLTEEEKTQSAALVNEIPPEQLQELKTENTQLLQELESQLEKAKQAEQSLLSIMKLQSELAENLASQSEQINSLVDESFQAQGSLAEGNKQLASARQRSRKLTRLICVLSVIFGLLLLFFDYAS